MTEKAQATRVVCSLRPGDVNSISADLRRVPQGADLVEIRADRTTPPEVARLISLAQHPVVITVRRSIDGGDYEGSEDQRRTCLCRALEAGAAYVDVELDSGLRDLADGPDAGRVILSDHGTACRSEPLAGVYERMSRSSAAVFKIVSAPATPAGAPALRGLLARAQRDARPLIAFALGARGSFTRVLAAAWGSWGTYGSLDPDRPTAEGQLTTNDLLQVYDVASVSQDTDWFALIGSGVSGSPSPAVHREGYRAGGLDARLLPVELERPHSPDDLVRQLGLELRGLAVTIPLKESLARHCRAADDVARTSGCVNTVRREDSGWVGFNTDGPGALDRLRRHVELVGARVALVGAGGTARSLATVLRDAGARVRLFNRDPLRGRAVAAELGLEALPLDALTGRGWEVLVNATPLGRHGEDILRGRRPEGLAVLDAVYVAGETPLVGNARKCGLAVVDGREMLAAQAVRQFAHLTGRPLEFDAAYAAARRWLDSRAS